MAEVRPLPAEKPQGKPRVQAAPAEEMLSRTLHGMILLSYVTPLMLTSVTGDQ